MSGFITTFDPLALVALQAGQVPTPAREDGAAGDSRLDVPQRAISIGEPVPIVFGRWRDGAGGVFISPGATEARFENDEDNAITAFYHLILSEGQIDPIAVKDIFQRACRVGSHSQTYNRRAGTWEPGNFIVAREGYDLPEAPYYCGTLGAYPDISTLSFQTGLIPDGFDQWNRQVHAFIRGGMWVQRLEDDTLGPSDSFADLYRWLLQRTSRVPAALIDDDQLEAADTFLRVNGLRCNTWIQQSTNLADLAAQWSGYFLLAPSDRGGQKGLRPVLPTTNTGAIDTGLILPAWGFTEASILPGSFELQYTSLSDRQPFVAQITWRQQLEDDIGIVRTAEVRFGGTAEVGPYESHDLSEFCTTELHAVRAGAYIVSKRVYTEHTARFETKPGEHSTVLGPGDIIRVRLQRNATSFAGGVLDYLYQIERVTKTLAGNVSYEVSHFPIDSQGRSLVARAVIAAQPTGILLDSNKTGVSCDVNSSTDNTIPDETFTEFDGFNDFDLTIPRIDSFNLGGGFGTGGLDSGGTGPIEDGAAAGGGGGVGGGGTAPKVGDQVDNPFEPDDGCTIVTKWYVVDTATGDRTEVTPDLSPGGDEFLIVTGQMEGKELLAIGYEECPGKEPELKEKNFGVVEAKPPWETYAWFRYVGTGTVQNSTGASTSFSVSTPWYPTSSNYGFVTGGQGGTADGVICTTGGTTGARWVGSGSSVICKPKSSGSTENPTLVIAGVVSNTIVARFGTPRGYGSTQENSVLGPRIKSMGGSFQFSDDKINIAAAASEPPIGNID